MPESPLKFRSRLGLCLHAILNEKTASIGIAGYLHINQEHCVIEVGDIHLSGFDSNIYNSYYSLVNFNNFI